jgi:hypothetical protein
LEKIREMVDVSIKAIVPPCAYQKPYSENDGPLRFCESCINDSGNLICSMYKGIGFKNNGHGGEMHFMKDQSEVEEEIARLNRKPSGLEVFPEIFF